MSRGLLSAGWSLWRTSLRQDRRKTLTALVLIIAGAVAWPLVAVLLRVIFDAVNAGRPVPRASPGSPWPSDSIAGLTFGHFAHVAYFELAELDVLHVHQELMEATNGSSGMAHYERSEFADKITVLEQDAEQLRVGLQAAADRRRPGPGDDADDGGAGRTPSAAVAVAVGRRAAAAGRAVGGADGEPGAGGGCRVHPACRRAVPAQHRRRRRQSCGSSA